MLGAKSCYKATSGKQNRCPIEKQKAVNKSIQPPHTGKGSLKSHPAIWRLFCCESKS